MAITQRSTRYGKGFGDAAPCPGTPGCPGYIDPSINQAIQNAIADAGSPGVVDTGIIPAAAPSWISTIGQYSKAIYAGAAVLVVLALFSGGRR